MKNPPHFIRQVLILLTKSFDEKGGKIRARSEFGAKYLALPSRIRFGLKPDHSFVLIDSLPTLRACVVIIMLYFGKRGFRAGSIPFEGEGSGGWDFQVVSLLHKPS